MVSCEKTEIDSAFELIKDYKDKNKIDEDTFSLIKCLNVLKEEKSQESIDELMLLKEKYGDTFYINLSYEVILMNSFSYYELFSTLVENLVCECCDKQLINYYIFNNSLKEIYRYGSTFYRNVKLTNYKTTLFRITTNIEEDKMKLSNLKNKELVNIESYILYMKSNLGLQDDIALAIAQDMFNNTKSASGVLKKMVNLAIGQVNGDKSSILPSFSKSLGVALYKYAHEKSELVIMKNADINCIRFKNGQIKSFQNLIKENEVADIQDINGFCIDFSFVRDDEIKNLNTWATAFLDEQKRLACTLSSPIKDRHVVNTFFDTDKTTPIKMEQAEFLLLNWIYIKLISKNIEITPTVIDSEVDNLHKTTSELLELFKEGQLDEMLINTLYNYTKNERTLDKFKLILSAVEDWHLETNYFNVFKKATVGERIKFLNNTEKLTPIMILKELIYFENTILSENAGQ